MRERNSKIIGSLIFILLVSCIIYLTFFSENKTNKGVIEMIQVTGNHLLPENDYLTFSRLDDASVGNENLTVAIIKDRLEKHPYIDKADVSLEDYKRVRVILYEKEMKAVILSGSEPYMISHNFEVLPLLLNTKFDDLTVISNPEESEKLKPMSIFRNENIVQAFKIIDAAKMTNPEISRKLSEINLRGGSEIILTFSGVKAPVIFGKGAEAKKMVYLEIMWDGIIDGKSFTEESDYIDLRFADEIYAGSNTADTIKPDKKLMNKKSEFKDSSL